MRFHSWCCGVVILALCVASCRGDESHVLPDTYEFQAIYDDPADPVVGEACGILPELVGTGFPEYRYYLEVGFDEFECDGITTISRVEQRRSFDLHEDIILTVHGCYIQEATMVVVVPGVPDCTMNFDLVLPE